MTRMGEKRCVKCGNVKPREHFYTSKVNKDGLQAYCHTCHQEANRRSRIKHRKEITERLRLWKLQNPEKHLAHQAVAHAVRARRLTAPDRCERCQRSGSLHAHHEDYTRMLDVIWLCQSCHARRHRELVAE